MALIDLGMVGQLSPRIQDQLLELLVSSSEGRSDEAADVLVDLGRRREGFDEPGFRRDLADLVTRHHRAILSPMSRSGACFSK